MSKAVNSSEFNCILITGNGTGDIPLEINDK